MTAKGMKRAVRLEDSGLMRRYVIKNNVQPFFSMGVTVPAAGFVLWH